MATVSSKSFEVVNEKTRQQKGPLVAVEISPGRHVKMYRVDAEAQGLIAPLAASSAGSAGDGQKNRPPGGNKMRPPGDNKGSEKPTTPPAGDQETAPPAVSDDGDRRDDDLSSIDGVGPATVRALAAAGIITFDQLRTADITQVVSGNALAAIEAWRTSVDSAADEGSDG